jgi:hypothetical protein
VAGNAEGGAGFHVAARSLNEVEERTMTETQAREEALARYGQQYGDILDGGELEQRLLRGLEQPIRNGLDLDSALAVTAAAIRGGLQEGTLYTGADDQRRRSATIAEIARARGQA